MSKIYHQYGLRKIYRGYVITLARDVVAFSAWFGCYETLKHNTCPKDRAPSMLWLMLLGAVTGEICWILSYPIDIVKTKIQSDSLINPQYRGIVDVIRKIYKIEGSRGFWRGFLPCAIRAPFVAAATFGVFELTLKLITPIGAANME